MSLFLKMIILVKLQSMQGVAKRYNTVILSHPKPAFYSCQLFVRFTRAEQPRSWKPGFAMERAGHCEGLPLTSRVTLGTFITLLASSTKWR